MTAEGRLLVIFLAGILGHFVCNGAESVDCSRYTTCDSCIAASVNCVWCADVMFNGESRCYVTGTNVTCSDEQEPTGNETVTQNNNEQIRPQAVNVELRNGETRTLDFTFQPGSGFPLDVYFLMDFGTSEFGNEMIDDFFFFRNNLPRILEAIGNASADNQVAFGTFVDKPVETFVGTLGSAGCVGRNRCYYPHSFIHHINFTAGSAFQAAFNMTFALPDHVLDATSVKINPFSSGLDAVVQVAECLDAINWRDTLTTRRVLIYMSDSAFHLSSDAWIGGQARPHDEKCHLAPNPDFLNSPAEFYLAGRPSDHYPALQQEYASPALVQNKLEKARIVPAFLVTADQTDVYSNLVEALSQNNAALFELASDSSNLVDLLNELFGTLQANIRLSPEVVDGLRVEVNASCGTAEFPNRCTGVTQGDVHTFTVTLTLEKCTEALQNGVLLPISDPFLGTALINVTALCTCECSTSSAAQVSSECNNQGTRRCGICDCNDNFYGPRCTCDREPNCPISNGLECSGQGECDECGKCTCTNDFYGDRCECSDTNCGTDSGGLCSGNGMCSCGVCICNSTTHTMKPGSTLCDCPLEEATCVEPQTETLCTQRGNCTCGACECEENYGGPQCENCLTPESCVDRDCQIYSRCIDCLLSITADNTLVSRDTDQCPEECEGIRVIFVSGQDDETIVSTVHECSMALGSCSLRYFIEVGERRSNAIYILENPQECALVVPPWAIAIAVFIALLILGTILLALLKLIVYLLDYMEYKRFEKDITRTQFGETENPIYRAPETQHPNPLFQGKFPDEKSGSLPPAEKEPPVKFLQ